MTDATPLRRGREDVGEGREPQACLDGGSPDEGGRSGRKWEQQGFPSVASIDIYFCHQHGAAKPANVASWGMLVANRNEDGPSSPCPHTGEQHDPPGPNEQRAPLPR